MHLKEKRHRRKYYRDNYRGNYYSGKHHRDLKGALTGVALLLGLIVIVAFLFSGTLISLTFGSGDVEKYVFQYINEERASRGLPVLGNDSNLCIIAKGWSGSMAKTGVLEHGDFQSRLGTIGYSGVYRCGEIIENYSGPVLLTIDPEMYTSPAAATARELVNGWLNSPPHREIMLDPSGGAMGVAVSKSAQVSYFSVVDFKFV